MPDPYYIQFRLCVDIKGPPVVSLGQDIISIRFNENLAQCNLLEVSVNNWGIGNNGILGYKYSEGNLLQLGASISLYVSDFVLAEGTIATLAPSFPNGTPSTLMFTVDAKHPPQETSQRVLQKVLTLAYGSELVEFHPVIRNTENLFQPRIVATGMVEGGGTETYSWNHTENKWGGQSLFWRVHGDGNYPHVRSPVWLSDQIRLLFGLNQFHIEKVT